MSTWETHEGVTCVECPKCAFTFDADHEDMQGGYSCPVCRQAELETLLRRLLAWDSWNPPDPQRDGWADARYWRLEIERVVAHKEETP